MSAWFIFEPEGGHPCEYHRKEDDGTVRSDTVNFATAMDAAAIAVHFLLSTEDDKLKMLDLINLEENITIRIQRIETPKLPEAGNGQG